MGRGNGGIGSGVESSSSAENRSSAAPGPQAVQLNPNMRETLSKERPMLSSEVVASILKEAKDFANKSSVWPPDISRVRKGNLGGLVDVVSKGVNAWAC